MPGNRVKSNLGVFPLAIGGLTAVVENEPLGVAAGPAHCVALPGVELGGAMRRP